MANFRDLHPEIREPLVKAAEAFKVHWDSVTLKEETKQPFLPF